MLVDCVLSALAFTTELASIMLELHANRKRGLIIPVTACALKLILLNEQTDPTVTLNSLVAVFVYHSFQFVFLFHRQT